jgi:hypothetical protein
VIPQAADNRGVAFSGKAWSGLAWFGAAWFLSFDYQRQPGMSKKPAVEKLAEDMAALGLHPKREYLFAKSIKRHWRNDFCFVSERLIIEIEGGVYTGGRHVTGKGFEDDAVKYNTAVLMNYRVLRFSSGQVYSGYALQTVVSALYNMQAA